MHRAGGRNLDTSPLARSGSSPAFNPDCFLVQSEKRRRCALQTARLIPPRFAPGLSATRGDFSTGDPDVSPDRTRTGRPP